VNGLPTFRELAAIPEARLDLLALALAGEFRQVDAAAALGTLEDLASDLRTAVEETGAEGDPAAEAAACAAVLGETHGFAGDTDQYDRPANSMLDVVLRRRRGLPILLAVVYVETARRAGIALGGVGLPGHFVAGHFGADPPLLLDPFGGGGPVENAAALGPVRPWTAHEIAMRMLNNLVGAYDRRGDVGSAIRAASMRLQLPAPDELRKTLELELRSLQAQLN
jgi:regulator of sirC expression with transglutaminase-like and TPR domain